MAKKDSVETIVSEETPESLDLKLSSGDTLLHRGALPQTGRDMHNFLKHGINLSDILSGKGYDRLLDALYIIYPYLESGAIKQPISVENRKGSVTPMDILGKMDLVETNSLMARLLWEFLPYLGMDREAKELESIKDMYRATFTKTSNPT